MRKLKPYMACIITSDSVTTWTVAHQVPLSMGCPTQEYWSEWPFSPPGDLPYKGWEPCPLCLLHGQENFLHWKAYASINQNWYPFQQIIKHWFFHSLGTPPPPFSSPSLVVFFFFLKKHF